MKHHPRHAYEWAEAAIALGAEQGFTTWGGLGLILRGWVLAAQGQRMAGLAQIRQGLTAWRARGRVFASWVVMVAEAYWTMEQPAEGLRVLSEVQAATQARGERFLEAELARLTGELRLAQSLEHHSAATTCFHQALAVARHQEAKSLELRAAMSLARLWQQQGKRTEARALLAPIYSWFTEGFDTADLQEAKTLLEALA